ncbi:pentatricopeptide repeat-containing protein At3g22470, mitochondrial-like [Mercurialis annua]|uniref:pentatricopeptide repeat-containing protein At3g22470, mitochondrial-like n=1 Tax=Mercurialis annua TaxID=3986 RepID=UPI00215FB296|nr:pentatricopeptide repeat-containing protein At3g22470, mitochondrial-like [Mercurialis annua]
MNQTIFLFGDILVSYHQNRAFWSVPIKIDGYCQQMQFRTDVVTYTIMINVYCKNKRIDDAKQLVQEMHHKGRLVDGQELFKNIRRAGPSSDIVTYASMTHGFCKHGYYDAALALFMKLRGLGGLKYAKDLFFRLSIQRLQPDAYTYTSLLGGICREGLLNEAHQVFRKMEEDGCFLNDCTYNVIIQGFIRHNDLQRARQLIVEMVAKGFSADATTTSLIIVVAFDHSAHCSSWFSLHVKMGTVVCEMLRFLVMHIMGEMYVKCCSVDEASPESGRMARKDVARISK